MRIIFALALLFFIACNDAEKNEPLQMTGAYTMVSQTMKGGNTDSTITTTNQMKIFTGEHVMYARFRPADSSSGFGIGTYTANADSITENIFYAAADSGFSTDARSYSLAITKTENGYTQVIPDITRSGDTVHYRLSEEYSMAKDTMRSPLDGAWKLTRIQIISGTDTTTGSTTQYKVYAAGHFMFGGTTTDSAGKVHTGMGYGKFMMKSPDKVTESIAVSTYAEISGQDVDLEIVMNGSDAFRQTVVLPNGLKLIEDYQRIGK